MTVDLRTIAAAAILLVVGYALLIAAMWLLLDPSPAAERARSVTRFAPLLAVAGAVVWAVSWLR